MGPGWGLGGLDWHCHLSTLPHWASLRPLCILLPLTLRIPHLLQVRSPSAPAAQLWRANRLQLPGPGFWSALGGAYLNSASVVFFLEKFLLSRLWAKVTQMFSGLRVEREFILWDHPQACGMIHRL